MSEKFILYLGGGAMAGVFGAGVVTKFQELDIYDKIEAVYGASAGALNGAYFLTKQTKFGLDIYAVEMPKNLIRYKNTFKAILHRFQHTYGERFSRKKISNVLDIRYIFEEVIRNRKRLDFDYLKSQRIPFYVKVLNLSSFEIENLNIDDHDPVKLLKAAVDIAPYTFDTERIGKFDYIDGALKELIGLNYLLKKYPNRKIVLVLNFPIKRGIHFYIKDFFEGLFSIPMYGKNLYKCYLNRESGIRKDIDLAINNDRVLLIYPVDGKSLNPASTDKDKILESFAYGREQGMKIIDFLK